MIHLLDVNVLIALVDPEHSHTRPARRWFERHAASGWATCPLTENGLLRIVSNPRYANAVGSPAVAINGLVGMKNVPQHHCWADDISLSDELRVNPQRLPTSAHLTDIYLLALAVAHGGELATFDRRLTTSAVAGGSRALHVIDFTAA
ncbi:MAG: PIN domain-containing protein [Sphingomonas sp.]|nr:PIN domain-containing protein [Sphingomonas sp.]